MNCADIQNKPILAASNLSIIMGSFGEDDGLQNSESSSSSSKSLVPDDSDGVEALDAIVAADCERLNNRTVNWRTPPVDNGHIRIRDIRVYFLHFQGRKSYVSKNAVVILRL